MDNPILLNYSTHEGIVAFSSTRRGGCSKGTHASFNVNAYCGDDIDDLLENRRSLCHKLDIGIDRLIMPHQVHGVECRNIDEAFMQLSEEQRKEVLEGVDALSTQMHGVCIGVSTADCIPILLYDPEKCAVAAIHAGWRGTQKKVVVSMLDFMARHYGTDSRNVLALIGPGISMDCFEVGQEVYDAFAQAQFPMDSISRRYKDSHADDMTKWHINLWEANRILLMSHGVEEENIQVAGICTYQNDNLFFSARKHGVNSGRMLTAIMIK
ncbi:MAG: peptidoglycan editing factor PgeF [Bacteroidaceae bacterium]|nr:peptidoglycan editing factor PgeF [Bacteroidaceae bacterium]